MTDKKVIVGYVCDSNPFVDKTAWSGLNYKIRESIENAGFDVVWIDCRPNGKLSKICRLWNEFFHGTSTMYEHTRLYFRLRAKAIDNTLLEKCDILFFPRGAQMMKYLKTNKPYIYYSDATFQLLCGYYWKPLSKWQYKTGNSLEADAISKSRINIRASHWAANSVTRDYGYAPEHTYVLKFGANLEDDDMNPVEPYDGHGRLNILFSGVDWDRKGAVIAIKTIEILNEKGIDAHLLMVGIRSIPQPYNNHPLIEDFGYLNKSIPSQYQKYIEVVKKCHLFLLPTKAECAGIVFGECSAFGIPIFTYDTGGIADYVLNGENGYRLPPSSGPNEYSNLIFSLVNDEKYHSLCKGCIRIYRDKLNWQAWSRSFYEIVSKELTKNINILSKQKGVY